MSHNRLSPGLIDDIRKLHADDPSLYTRKELADLFGVSSEMVRRILDPELWALINARQAARERSHRSKKLQRNHRRERRGQREAYADKLKAELPRWNRPISDDELNRIRRAQPPDTRDLTQVFCGDPPPGRSALDKRQSLEG